MDATDTHYDRLAVSRDAPPEVIRAAYKALTQKYHPDRNPGDSEAARVMTLLNQSYDVLMDPLRRAEYDTWIDAQENGGEESLTGDVEQDVQRTERVPAGWIRKTIGIKTALLLAFGAVFVISAVVGGILAKAQEERGAMEAGWAAAHVQQGRAAAIASRQPPTAAAPVKKNSAPLENPPATRPVAQPEPERAAAPQSARLDAGGPTSAGSGVPAARSGSSSNFDSALPSDGARDGERLDLANSKLAAFSGKPEAAAERPRHKQKPSACAETDAGDAFPKESYSGYLPGQSAMNANGRSTFTVDNMQVDEDVLVKLVDVDNPTLARSFQVRANSSFTAEQLGHGKYRVLYRPRKSSCEWYAVGGVFDVREAGVEGSVRPAKAKITLHGSNEIAPAEIEGY